MLNHLIGNGSVWSVAYSPDGKNIASGSEDGTIKVWNAQTGQCVSTLTVDSGVLSVVFAPDGSKIAAAHPYTIQLFDAQTQAKLGSPLSGHSGYVRAVSWSPDGNMLASGSDDETIKLWDAQSGKLNSTLSGHSRYVTAVSYCFLFSNVWWMLTNEHFTAIS